MFLIKQKDAMDCGPACLAMVVKYYGRYPDLEPIHKEPAR
ncbi:cysteine peptidase family C39 domain-containing protein [uncultured Porphyromonas sp.]|nr:cysteine peptidase family C39 domain-containing protein [uncultured Porphyromonas sp.]